MAILNWYSIPHVVVSSALPNDSPPPSINPIPHLHLSKLPKRLKQQPQQQQPSVMEIERAIGAGVFRERDINREGEETTTTSLLDNIMRNTVGKNEGSVEKKLRETGEWLIDQTQNTSRSAGKQILVTMFVWMIPLWMFAFLLASGLLHLPFHTPLLDDILS